MKKGLLALITFISIHIAFSQGPNKDEVAIRQTLNRQVKDWNTGNVDDFMKGYWKSDSLLFIGKNGPKYGYNTTLENYKKIILTPLQWVS
jgi:hypothetical protein